jgi:hypothetical protein
MNNPVFFWELELSTIRLHDVLAAPPRHMKSFASQLPKEAVTELQRSNSIAR